MTPGHSGAGIITLERESTVLASEVVTLRGHLTGRQHDRHSNSGKDGEPPTSAHTRGEKAQGTQVGLERRKGWGRKTATCRFPHQREANSTI
jgi:hypothetical protein